MNRPIVYSDLTCPSTHLQSVLRDLFCKLQCGGGGTTTTTIVDGGTFTVTKAGTVLTFTHNATSTTLDLAGIFTDTKVTDVSIYAKGFVVTLSDNSAFTIDLTSVVKALETKTSIVDSVNSFSYTNEAGIAIPVTKVNSVVPTTSGTILDIKVNGVDGSVDLASAITAGEAVTSLVDNHNGSVTFTNEKGDTNIIPIGGITVVDEGNGTYTLTLSTGQVVTISDTSISTLVKNVNGTYTYTDEAGTVTTFITGDTITSNGGGIYTVTKPDGTSFQISDTSVSTLANNGNGTYTYTDETGTTTTFKAGGISTNAGQSITLGTDGLPYFKETAFSATSGGTIKVTAGGTNGHTPVLDVAISSDAGNILSVGTDGKLKVVDTDTILTVTNNAAPYSYNSVTETLQIPQTPEVVQAPNGTGFVLNKGDSTTTPIYYYDNWRDNATKAKLPDGTTDYTEEIHHNSDIYVNQNVGVGNGGGSIAYNTRIGTNALAVNSSGVYNTATGHVALSNNTTGNYNTANGAEVLKANIDGGENTGVGAFVLSANTTGNQNTAVGSSALTLNTSGNYNSAFGYGGLLHNTTGQFNSSLGNSALYNNTTGINNVGVGGFALYSNVNGNDNTSNGYNSMYSNTSGASNSALGIDSLGKNTTGSQNTAVGRKALYANTTGGFNTALGTQASQGNTTGSFNTAVGYLSLSENTAGINNVSIGREALFNNTTASFNTANGVSALYNNTTGTELTSSGVQSLYHNITGNYNTATGASALYANTTGLQNSAVGRLALYYNTQNNNNSALGYNSFSGFNVLSTGGTASASTGTDITLSNPLGGTWSVGEHIFLVTIAPFSNTLANGYDGSYEIVNSTTLRNLKTNNVFGGSGTIANVEIRQGYKISNSTAVGYNSQPTISNQVVLGDSNTVEVRSTGNFFGAGFTVVSDERIKSNIQPLSNELRTALLSISPVMYHNTFTGKDDIGVIAQSIPDILKPYLLVGAGDVIHYRETKAKILAQTTVLGVTIDNKMDLDSLIEKHSKELADLQKEVMSQDITPQEGGQHHNSIPNITPNPRIADLEGLINLLMGVDTVNIVVPDFLTVDYAKLAAMIALVK